MSLGPLADFVGFHLRLAQEASFQAFARRVRDLDLRPGRFAVLARGSALAADQTYLPEHMH